MRIFSAAVVGLAGALFLRPAPASAHAFLDHADPRVGSSLSSPPPTITLTFTEGVEPAFSKIEVLDGDGKVVAVGALEHPDDTALRVSLPTLRPGSYKVKWKVVSVDTHETEGTFQFSVKSP
jgi:methionine-rich copper-binding protein CopC